MNRDGMMPVKPMREFHQRPVQVPSHLHLQVRVGKMLGAPHDILQPVDPGPEAVENRDG